MYKSKSKNSKTSNRREQPEFEQKLVDLARVTRVTKGGKKLSFRALVVIGNRKGDIGFACAKGKDVTLAVSKAVEKARKNLIRVPITQKGSIVHEVRYKFKSAKILLKPAPQGTGIRAGGPMRVVLDLAGVENIVGKMLGNSGNKINYVTCTYKALKSLPKLKNKTTEKDSNKETRNNIQDTKKLQ